MPIADFLLERYFARYEFAVPYVLGASDVEPLTLAEVVRLADPELTALWANLTLGYTESAGHPQLRAEIATLYQGMTSDDILTFAGAEEGIFLAMHALLAAGDHAVVVTPGYQSLHEVARAIGAAVTCVNLDPGDWSLDVDLVRAALRPNTRVVVVNFPHNPTGAQLPRASLERLLSLCDSRGIHLFSDEVYRFLEVDPADRLPPAATLSDRAISLGVMSKAFALAGLRIGWIATRDRTLRLRIAALKDYTTICSSAPSEILALIALRARDRVLARSRAIIDANLPLLDAFFERHGDRFAWVRPRAGSVCFPRLVHGGADPFADALVRQKGVLVVPGSQFGGWPGHFRLGFGRQDMGAALALVEEP